MPPIEKDNRKAQEIKIAQEGDFTIRSHPMTLEVFRVIESDLDNLGEFSNESSVSLGVASICIGASITLWLVVITTTASPPEIWTRPFMFASALATLILGVFFGANFFIKNKKWRKLLNKIKNQRNELDPPLEPSID